MNAENLTSHQGCDRQAVKNVCEHFPNLQAAAPLALVVKPVNPINRSTFMISAQNKKVFGVFNLVAEQQKNGFQTLLAAVDVVP